MWRPVLSARSNTPLRLRSLARRRFIIVHMCRPAPHLQEAAAPLGITPRLANSIEAPLSLSVSFPCLASYLPIAPSLLLLTPLPPPSPSSQAKGQKFQVNDNSICHPRRFPSSHSQTNSSWPSPSTSPRCATCTPSSSRPGVSRVSSQQSYTTMQRARRARCQRCTGRSRRATFPWPG